MDGRRDTVAGHVRREPTVVPNVGESRGHLATVASAATSFENRIGERKSMGRYRKRNVASTP